MFYANLTYMENKCRSIAVCSSHNVSDGDHKRFDGIPFAVYKSNDFLQVTANCRSDSRSTSIFLNSITRPLEQQILFMGDFNANAFYDDAN